MGMGQQPVLLSPVVSFRQDLCDTSLAHFYDEEDAVDAAIALMGALILSHYDVETAIKQTRNNGYAMPDTGCEWLVWLFFNDRLFRTMEYAPGTFAVFYDRFVGTIIEHLLIVAAPRSQNKRCELKELNKKVRVTLICLVRFFAPTWEDKELCIGRVQRGAYELERVMDERGQKKLILFRDAWHQFR
jgi:hypothetical protein